MGPEGPTPLLCKEDGISPCWRRCGERRGPKRDTREREKCQDLSSWESRARVRGWERPGLRNKSAGCLQVGPVQEGHSSSTCLGQSSQRPVSQTTPATLTILVIWRLRVTVCNLATASETPPAIFQSVQWIQQHGRFPNSTHPANAPGHLIR